jgi:hypothetical protein
MQEEWAQLIERYFAEQNPGAAKLITPDCQIWLQGAAESCSPNRRGWLVSVNVLSSWLLVELADGVLLIFARPTRVERRGTGEAMLEPGKRCDELVISGYRWCIFDWAGSEDSPGRTQVLRGGEARFLGADSSLE